MTVKVHVVDGTYELFRHYYARIPPRRSPDAAAPNAPDAKRYKAMAAAITSRTARLR